MSDTCPKCGMKFAGRPSMLKHVDSPFCIDQQLRIMTARAKNAEAEVAGWEEEAKVYASNANYWRERAEKAEAEVASEYRRGHGWCGEMFAVALARAEKAEALAQYRLEALEARDRVCAAEHSMDMHGQEVATRCRYCDSWPGDCLSDCPTVTHPKGGLE